MGRIKEFLIEVAETNGLDPNSQAAYDAATRALHDRAYAKVWTIVHDFRSTIPFRDGKTLQPFVVVDLSPRTGLPTVTFELPASSTWQDFRTKIWLQWANGSVSNEELEDLLRR
jgi:hypothetical protein